MSSILDIWGRDWFSHIKIVTIASSEVSLLIILENGMHVAVQVE